MKCLIIAAGKGSRLSKRGDSKPLISLLGLSLIERTILTAKGSGIKDFYVVTGYNGEKLRKHLNRICHKKNINISHIINEEWEKGNGISVLKAKKLFNENFILLMADHIFDESILMRLKSKKIADDEVMLAVDYNVEENKLIDIEDVTKVLVDGGKIVDIGKDIENYNAYDTGIFLCSPAIFNGIERSLSTGDDSLSGGVKELAGRGRAKTFDIKESYWIDVDNEETFEKAESRLLSTLNKTSDGPISRYLNRPISTKISRYLVRTKITPNCVSLISFAICSISALFFFLGGYISLVIGGVLAQISSIIDGCDGEIARLKFQKTDFGRWFDAVLDRYADAFLLFGLTFYVFSSSGNLFYLFIGFLAIIGTFMNSYTADKYDGLMKRKIGSKGYYFRIGRDARLFIIFLGSLVNLPLLALIIIALLMNIENVRRIVALYKYE
ncbi:MAG: hypothetical protein DRP89_06550 [Candidatus Neomarinimicrobiota bacterium]|nr:MAG: hypothetical protein DRP89_06550 [Candidatus Neomarinimicrobiota bacterium]